MRLLIAISGSAITLGSHCEDRSTSNVTGLGKLGQYYEGKRLVKLLIRNGQVQSGYTDKIPASVSEPQGSLWTMRLVIVMETDVIGSPMNTAFSWKGVKLSCLYNLAMEMG